MATFVTALVSMIVVPRTQNRTPQQVPSAPRPDTLSLVGNAALGRIRLAEADSALGVARQEIAAADSARLATAPTDSALVEVAQRDSLRAGLERLEGLIARVERSPLPTSYRALGSAPELRGDARVRALLDSLADVEREREGFGSVGGVDPIFVALTSRASEIGRSIQGIAVNRRNELRVTLGPDPTVAAVVVEAPEIDTTSLIATRDSITRALSQGAQELERRRAVAAELDLREERARERANAVAPPLALLAAAFVLSGVIGFAVALVGELRKPRVTDAMELERFLGTRVLSTVETSMPSVDRGRRQADRSAPPYFDPGAEGYQLAYLGLATDHPSLLMTTITGDDPGIAAVVASNLAAIAADEARSTLLLDLDPTCRASAALRARVAPGIGDLVRGEVQWADATASAQVGRDKCVDLVPCGAGPRVEPEDLVEFLHREGARLGRYYDAIFVVASPSQIASGIAGALASPEVIFCAQPGITPLRALKAQLDAIRAAGGSIRGVVLWNAERPLLPTPRELTSEGRRRVAHERVPVGAH